MAALPDNDRIEIWTRLMRDFASIAFGQCDGTKSDLRDMINAYDDYIEANQVAINNAIPQPARGRFTALQKTLAFCYVALKKAGR